MALRSVSLAGVAFAMVLLVASFRACQADMDEKVPVQGTVEVGGTSDNDITNLMQDTVVVDRHRGQKGSPDATGSWFFYAIRAGLCAVLLLVPALLHSGIATAIVDNFNLARNSAGVAVSGATFLSGAAPGGNGRSLSAQGEDRATAVPGEVLDEILNEDEPCCDFAFVPGLQRSAELIPASTDGGSVTHDMGSARVAEKEVEWTDEMLDALMADAEKELDALGSMSRLQNHVELTESKPSEGQVVHDAADALMAELENEVNAIGSKSRLHDDAEYEDFMSSGPESRLPDDVAENIMSKLSFWLDKPTDSGVAQGSKLAAKPAVTV